MTVKTGQPAAAATTFAYAGAPVAIPDNAPAGASVTIPVSGLGYADKVTFSVDGATCNTSTASTTVGIDHSFVSDLTATLTAPGGRSATLFSGGGGERQQPLPGRVRRHGDDAVRGCAPRARRSPARGGRTIRSIRC